MDTASFSYSRFFAAVQLGLTPAFMILSLGLIAGGVSMAFGRLEDIAVAVGAIAAGFWTAVIMWQWFRYRHSLRERYTLDSHGVAVESSGVTNKLLWSDFDSAEYLIIPGMLRLKSRALPKPVFLFLDKGWGGTAERNKLALSLTRSHMDGRYRKSWAL